MKKISLITICLAFVALTTKAQSTCNCKESSSDNLEKLTALTAGGYSTPAYDLYLSEFNLKNVAIDPDLERAVKILHYQSPSYWNQVSNLEDRLSYLKKKRKGFLGLGGKKSADDYDNVYWINKNNPSRIGCLESIISKIKSLKGYTDWKNSGKKEQKKQVIDDANEKIEKGTKDKQQIVVTNPDKNPSQSNDEVIKKLEEFIKQQEAKSTNQGATTTTIQGESAKNNIETYTINFNEGEIKLDSKALETLKSIIQAISSHTVSEIRIEGFASQTGSRETNFAISMSRCYEVKKALQAGGYTSDFTILPYGETDNKDFRAVVITLRGK